MLKYQTDSNYRNCILMDINGQDIPQEKAASLYVFVRTVGSAQWLKIVIGSIGGVNLIWRC